MGGVAGGGMKALPATKAAGLVVTYANILLKDHYNVYLRRKLKQKSVFSLYKRYVVK